MPTEDRKTCSKCGAEKPLTDFHTRNGLPVSWCKSCKRAYDRQRRAAKGGQLLAQHRDWYALNRVENLAYQAEWRAKNREHKSAADKEWREQNIERKAATDAAWRAANAEHVKAYLAAWRKANPERVRDLHRARRARKSGALVSRVYFKTILLRDLGVCGICLKPIMQDKIELDHIIPLAAGGTHEPDNVQLAHPTCNRRKWAKVGFTLAEDAA